MKKIGKRTMLLRIYREKPKEVLKAARLAALRKIKKTARRTRRILEAVSARLFDISTLS